MNRLNMTVPESQSLNRGGTIDLPITIEGDIEESVRLHLENLPKGVDADECEIAKGQHRGICHLHASDDAELTEDCEVKVVADVGGESEEKPIHLAVTDKEGGEGAGKKESGGSGRPGMKGGQQEFGQKDFGREGQKGKQEPGRGIQQGGQKNREKENKFGGQGSQQQGKGGTPGGQGGTPYGGQGSQQQGKGGTPGGQGGTPYAEPKQGDSSRQGGSIRTSGEPGKQKEFQEEKPRSEFEDRPENLPGKAKYPQENKPDDEDMDESKI